MSPKTLILAYFTLIQYVLCLHFIAFGLVLQFSAVKKAEKGEKRGTPHVL
jgi:hypothetical protein